MTEFLKYVKGYLRIKVWGFSPERFMNLCGNRGVLLWDIEKDQDAYYMCISLRNFYKLRPIVRKSRTKVAILQRYGLPFLIPVICKRKVFVLGFVLTVTFWYVSSLFIWDIKVSGNFKITEDSFMTFLDRADIKIGMPKNELDIENMEKEIRKAFPEITWTSAKLSGTKLLIEVKENDAPIVVAIAKQEEGMDLVAEYDGVITEMIVRKGVPKVAIGDEITKGMVLVEGSIPIYNEDATLREYRYVDADADILVEHIRNYQESLPFDYVSKEYTGRTEKEFFVRFGEHKFEIPQKNEFLMYDSVIRESRLSVFEKLSIPLHFGSCTYREYLNVEREYSLEQARQILQDKLNTFIISLEEKGVQIIEKNVKIDTNGGKWTIQGKFLVKESVGESIAILKQDLEESN